ncbi:AAA family ATPase [Catenulispora rubra]|uniref:AAA family ATPase n=1 Tax=Catenulispora rubra TaxID=280293 RepID=UPI0018925571|nr:AAA family ATPase [Catenulispora rubra]
MTGTAYSLSRKSGWRRYVDDPPRPRPEKLNREQLAVLGEDALDEYNESRKDWHANFGIMRTPQLEEAHVALEEIIDSNRQDPDRIRVPAAFDAFPGMGKTTIVNTYARDFDRRQRRRFGETTEDGHEHLPVFRVGLSSTTTLKSLNRRICAFYGHPGAQRGSAELLGEYALDCVLSCGTRLGVIDDLHFVNPRRRDGSDVSNHLKWLCSEFPVTFVYVGVGLREKGFLSDGLTGHNAAQAQNPRRWTVLGVSAFDIAEEHGREDWLTLIKSIQSRIVLAEHRRGDLTALSDYLFERTTGHIGSLMSLIVRGCRRAIQTGDERISHDLLQHVQIDAAAEEARQRLAASLAVMRSTTR